jgi:hypothetical protein
MCSIFNVVIQKRDCMICNEQITNINTPLYKCICCNKLMHAFCENNLCIQENRQHTYCHECNKAGV